MKIFIDIGHPAHVHYFKHLIHELTSGGHQVVITARDKEMAHYLLKKEGLDYISRGRGSDNLAGKLFYLVKADWALFRIAKKENPDLFLSFASPYCAQVAWLMRKPCITLDDTETASLNHFLYKPFSTRILTPESFRKNLGSKQVRFPSFIELAYLHPNRFQPDPSIFNELGLSQGEKYVILRFVSLHANHDVGLKGISFENKVKAVQSFREFGKVFISSESELPEELKKYRLNIEPDRIHHVLAFASLMYGESATMASESAALGTPAIFVNNFVRKLGTIMEQAEKDARFYFPFVETKEEQIKSIEKGIFVLNGTGGMAEG
ncbi:MAG: DUF354 domain-containing protein [Balneolaceae bacterium]|nr:DUF354 domain-containing protein [Balneolaceae bacterium]